MTMTRNRAIEIFYACSNPTLEEFLLKVSEGGGGGGLTKSVEVKGGILLGIYVMNIDRLSYFYPHIGNMEFAARIT